MAGCGGGQRQGFTGHLLQVALDGSPAVGGIKEALMFPGCADFQPLAYVQGLAKAVEKLGGRIFENTRVMNTDKTYVRAIATQHPTWALQPQPCEADACCVCLGRRLAQYDAELGMALVKQWCGTR